MKKLSLTLFCIAFAISGCSNVEKFNRHKITLGAHPAVTPVDRTKPSWWQPRHAEVVERVKQGDVDLLMIGDSITHRWERQGDGKEIWDKYYAPRNAVNMGFGGDRTEHVLWRLENGEIDGISPKLAVLMIGTNNSNRQDYTAEEIADGIIAICQKLRAELPTTKILILAIFPRGSAEQRKIKNAPATFNPQWAKNNKASKRASKIADNKWIYYLDINKKFLDENGALTREVMPDLLHPKEKGYAIWAEAMEPTIKKLMGE